MDPGIELRRVPLGFFDIASWTPHSLIVLKSKVIAPSLILISLKRRGFEVTSSFAVNFVLMDQKNLFILFKILSLSSMI